MTLDDPPSPAATGLPEVAIVLEPLLAWEPELPEPLDPLAGVDEPELPAGVDEPLAPPPWSLDEPLAAWFDPDESPPLPGGGVPMPPVGAAELQPTMPRTIDEAPSQVHTAIPVFWCITIPPSLGRLRRSVAGPAS
jgi:hypothetical protein